MYFNGYKMISCWHFNFYFSSFLWVWVSLWYVGLWGFLPCINTSCPRESVFSVLYTNFIILSPGLWRVMFTVRQSHIQPGIYVWSVYSVPRLFYSSLLTTVHIASVTVAFPCLPRSCRVNLFLAPILLHLFWNQLSSS